MTREEWERCTDPEALLRYAAPRLSRQHLCLVLCEVLQPTVARRVQAHPEEWTAAWALAVLRAWCLFLVSDRELREAQAEFDAFEFQPTVLDRCVEGAIAAGLWPTSTIAHPYTWGLDVNPAAFIRRAAEVASLAASFEEPHPPDVAQRRSVLQRSAEIIRRLVPYPTTVDREWTNAPGIAWSGEFVLRIDGREVGDVVYRRDFASLSGDRAVAFDAAQRDGEPETELQVANRDFIERMREYGEAHDTSQPEPTPRPAPRLLTSLQLVPPEAIGERREWNDRAAALEVRERLRASEAQREEARRVEKQREERIFRLALPPSVALFVGLAWWLVSSGRLTSRELFAVLPFLAASVAIVPFLEFVRWHLDRSPEAPPDEPELGTGLGTALTVLILSAMGLYLCERSAAWVLRRFDTGFSYEVEGARAAATYLQPTLRELRERVEAGRRAENHAQLATLEQELADTLGRQRRFEALVPLSPRVEWGIATLVALPLLFLLASLLSLALASVLAAPREPGGRAAPPETSKPPPATAAVVSNASPPARRPT
jgi:hypothetical protein